MANVTNNVEIKCSRCGRSGHLAKECTLPYYCTSSPADRRMEAAKRRAEWQQKDAEWKAWRDEKAQKDAEWKAKRAEREAEFAARQAAYEARCARRKGWEVDSNGTETSTVATATVIAVDEAEVERMVMMDKAVRKFVKTLREISKLEELQDLDALQVAKLARKSEVESELNDAKGMARVRARDELKRQLRA